MEENTVANTNQWNDLPDQDVVVQAPKVKFADIYKYTDDKLKDYCQQMIGCYKQFSQCRKLYPKTARDTIDALKFHNTIMKKSNILVIVLTQYQLVGLYTQEPVPEEKNVTWEPTEPFYVFEF